MPRVLFAELDGDYSANDGSLPAGSNDFETLGLDQDPTLFAPRIDWTSGRWDWTLDWVGKSFGGIGPLTSGLVIDGVAFPAGNTVDTDLDLWVGRAAVTYDLVEDEHTTVGIGAGLGVYSAEANLVDLDSGARSLSNQDGLAPHLLGRLGRQWGEIDVQLLVGWLDFELNDVEAEYLDADAFVRWRFRGRDEGITWAVLAGYRYVQVDTSYNEESFDEDIDWKTELQGPYVGLSVGF